MQEMPSRFAPMPKIDRHEFMQIAFKLCESSELVFEEEYRYVSILMSLFGHRFHQDPRFQIIYKTLLNINHQNRMRQTQVFIEPLIKKVWGNSEEKKTWVDGARFEMKLLSRGQNRERTEYWNPHKEVFQSELWDIQENFYLKNSENSAKRLGLEGEPSLAICFWMTWKLGIEFDENPQFRWITRSVQDAGAHSTKKEKRLISILLKLTE